METAKIYNIGKSRTNTGLKLKFGKQERVFRLEFISNSPFAPSEFEKWKCSVEEAGLPLPTKVTVASCDLMRVCDQVYVSCDQLITEYRVS